MGVHGELLGLAFAAGLVAALNPCGFAMLPTYLMLVVSGTSATTPGRPAAVARAVTATLAMTAGFIAVFAVFGLLTVSAAATLQRYLPAVTVIVGAALIGVGLCLLSGRALHVPVRAPSPNRAPTRALGSMFGYGVAYAIASLSCTVGPFLAVTGVALRTGSPTQTTSVYAAYAAGFALIVGTLAVAAAFASATLASRLRRSLRLINRIGGALVTVIGLYVAYYGIYELRLAHTDADPADAVIATAGRVQGAIAGWVHAHGGWPWLVVLILLLMAAAAWTRRRRQSTANIRQ